MATTKCSICGNNLTSQYSKWSIEYEPKMMIKYPTQNGKMCYQCTHEIVEFMARFRNIRMAEKED